MRKPLVSVIMSCYNGEKYIKKSVSSIINQTYENWELIFWDNNSSDNSAKIISSFNDKRIKYFKSNKTTNLGVSRSNAISESLGDYIAFLDVDDYWLSEKLKASIECFEKNHDCVLYFSNYFIEYINKNITEKKNFKFNINNNQLNSVFDSYIKNTGLIAFLTVIIKKTALEKEDCYFDKNLHISADFELILRMAEKYKFVFDKKATAVYCRHSSNETLNSLNQQTKELLYCYEKLKKNIQLSEKLKSYFFNTINYNLSKIDLKNKEYKKFFIKFMSIKNLRLKIKILVILFLYFIGIKKL